MATLQGREIILTDGSVRIGRIIVWDRGYAWTKVVMHDTQEIAFLSSHEWRLWYGDPGSIIRELDKGGQP